MSESKMKAYKRAIKHQALEEHRKIIFTYLDGLCQKPLRTRIHFLWFILIKKNPHTGKRAKK